MRARRFISTVLWLRRQGILNRQYLRAAWIQSDPGWLDRLSLDLSEDEWDAYLEAMSS